MRQATPHPALRQLDVMVGEWDMWAAGRSAGPFRTEFTWLESGAFGSMTDRTWRQWRRAPGFHQRLTATVSPDGNTIEGRWEQSPDGERWTTDFDVTYTRTGTPRI